MCPCFNAGKEYKDIIKEEPEETICPQMGDDILEPDFDNIGDVTEEYEPEPIQIPTEPIVPNNPIETTEVGTIGEEEKPKQRPSILGFIVKILSKLFSHG